MPRIGPSGEIVINGWLSKAIATIAAAGVTGGFVGLLQASSLAADYHHHKEAETRELAELKARTDKLWDEAIETRVINTATQQEIGRARERQDRIEDKLNRLLQKQGIDVE